MCGTLVPCWSGVGTYYLSFSFWRKNPHGRGEDASTGGPECQAEACGGGERLGWEQCQGSYPVRDELKSRGEGYTSPVSTAVHSTKLLPSPLAWDGAG